MYFFSLLSLHFFFISSTASPLVLKQKGTHKQARLMNGILQLAVLTYYFEIQTGHPTQWGQSFVYAPPDELTNSY